MEKEEIHITDWQRILEGQVPYTFLIEAVIRILVAYLIIMVAARLMGNRMASDLSKVEMISRIMLAAAIGFPLQTPDKGLLGSAVVAVVAVVAERIISRQAAKNRRFEILSQDNIDQLVVDSVMQLGVMKRTRITRERLFAQLRSEQIEHLGEVERFYFEACGSFTLIKREKPGPGLSILPDWDKEIREEQKNAGKRVCTVCGTLKADSPTCSCGSKDWQEAVI